MAETFHTNLVNVANALSRNLNIRVTRTTLKTMLTENPFYPSLYSLSNTFEKLNVPHSAFRMEKENIDSLSTPFIAYEDKQSTGKDFVTVVSVTDKEVCYYAEHKKPVTISRDEFLNRWQGIVLKAEPGEEGGEKDFEKNRKKEIVENRRKGFLIAASVAVLSQMVFSLMDSLSSVWILPASILLLIKMAGLATALLLLVYETDKSNTFVKNICTAGVHTNCEAVLSSKAAKVLSMTWSEAGFFYFASTFLFLLIPSVDFSVKGVVLGAANIIAVPYIFFSLYYQWRVVKQWCPLCLTVQAVLAAELLWSAFNLSGSGLRTTLPFGANLTGFTINYILISLATPIIIWYILKPLIKRAKDQPLYKAAYKRLLYNPETFDQLLQQQVEAPQGFESLGITVGNPEAENTIIKVCNPYCGPCAHAHPVLEDIIRNNKNVKLKLIFTASNDKDDIRGAAARHMLAVSKKYPEQTEKALDDWYLAKKKDYIAYSEKYPMNGELKQQEEEIDKMKLWCHKAEILFTPTIYINGHRLPEKYRIEELKYIL